MHSNEKFLPQRRKFIASPLTLGLASAGVLGLASARADAAPSPTESGLAYPAELSLALLRDYQTAKASSYDRTGGNADAFKIEPGATQILMEAQGPGMVSHIWFTISAPDPQHLKKLILRMYWDGESDSVAYWYQTEPHAKFPALPPVADRLPRVFAVPKGAAPVK